ncbi:MAG: ATP-binding protein [Imperialibacter sp.]|uniref:ATP-binding protein n=1 Tax=Imperialibacter sp. TaxID=2038411 RepID=UPI0032EFB3C5
MSKMFAEIKRIVDEDISSRVSQYDVIFEAITNAIHANATSIECILNSYDNPIKENDTEIVRKKVHTISVRDNGDGLHDDNYDSFCKYRTEYKKALGCKGVGRFVFLKVYDNAQFNSSLFEKQQVRTFKFDFDFDTDNIESTPTEVKENLTEVSLNSLSESYLNYDKHIDRRIEMDLEAIREKVLLNLIPTLFFYKKKGGEITISFKDQTTSESVFIKPSDIPDFKERKFVVKDKEGKIFEFTLNHRIENVDGNLYAYYCANNRTVCDFAEKDLKLNFPYGYSGFLLLESNYFNSRVNNERNDFDIKPLRTDAFTTLSWDLINEELKKTVTDLVKEGIPETKEINKIKIREIHEERPYLINYIDETDIEIAGFIDKKKLIDNAKKKFDTAKEKILTSAGKEEYTDTELYEAIELTHNELVSYINDRILVIERLKKLIDNKERVEKIIHNLFMEMQTDDDYYAVGKNNLWLLDDRYTTYSYAASDKRIREVLKGIDEENGDTDILDDKPDLSLFFSHNPDKPERLKSVLVEIKPFDYQSKPDRKKFAGIQQLLDYVKAFKEKEKIEEVSSFLITEIDDKLAERLRTDGYTPLFSLESPIYHRFYNEPNISIFVISASTLIKDAEARNKVFLDIIKKQNKIKSLLS